MIDFQSATWKAIRQRAEERLATLRAEIETSGVSPERTNEIRGAIEENKQLLALAQPAPKIPTSRVSYTD